METFWTVAAAIAVVVGSAGCFALVSILGAEQRDGRHSRSGLIELTNGGTQ